MDSWDETLLLIMNWLSCLGHGAGLADQTPVVADQLDDITFAFHTSYACIGGLLSPKELSNNAVTALTKNCFETWLTPKKIIHNHMNPRLINGKMKMCLQHDSSHPWPLPRPQPADPHLPEISFLGPGSSLPVPPCASWRANYRQTSHGPS